MRLPSVSDLIPKPFPGKLPPGAGQIFPPKPVFPTNSGSPFKVPGGYPGITPRQYYY